ncbi:ribosome maturation protein [Phycomyces nitens]|nr:ribosome maturation protein [Phycomyces nitens]
MTKSLGVKIIFRHDNDEFFVVGVPGMAAKWRKDKTIPLIDVVQSFEVLMTPNGSSTGEAIRPSKGVLESAFDTNNVDKIVGIIVESGIEKNM